MTASRLEFGAAQGLTFSMTNDCSSPISGTRCFKLGQRDDKVRTTIAPSDLVLRFSCKLINGLSWTHDNENVHVYWLGFCRILVVLCKYSRQLSRQRRDFSKTESDIWEAPCAMTYNTNGRYMMCFVA